MKVTHELKASAQATLGALSEFIREAQDKGAPINAELRVQTDGRRKPTTLNLTLSWDVTTPAPRTPSK